MRGRGPGDGHDRGAPELRDVSAQELERLIGEEERLLLVAFLTERCEPCRELRPRLEALEARGGSGDSEDSGPALVAVEVDAEPEAARRHSVAELPTLVFFKHGRELHRLKAGALPASTLELLGPPAR